MSARHSDEELLKIIFQPNEQDSTLAEMQLARDLLRERGVDFCQNCGSRDLRELLSDERHVLDDERTPATHECESCGESVAPEANA